MKPGLVLAVAAIVLSAAYMLYRVVRHTETPRSTMLALFATMNFGAAAAVFYAVPDVIPSRVSSWFFIAAGLLSIGADVYRGEKLGLRRKA